MGLLAWIALVPLLIALEGKPLKEAFVLSHVTGLIFFSGAFDWIRSVSHLNYIDYVLLVAIYFPLYVSLWGFGLNWVRKRTGLSAVLVGPPLWLSLEYIRAHLSFLSLPCMLLGHSQYLHTSLIQITSLTGVYGISFLIVLMNLAIADVRLRFPKPFNRKAFNLPALKPLMVPALLLIATYLYGFTVLSNGLQGDHMTIAMIQGNISKEHKWNGSYRREIIDRYTSLARTAARRAPALTIWPETAIPGDVRHDLKLRRELGQVAMDTKTYLLVGSAESAKFDLKSKRSGRSYYNSVSLFTPEGKMDGQYRKLRLFPFGEYDPLRGFATWLRALDSKLDKVLPGEQYTLFNVGRATFGVVICWENMFPDLFREFVKRGARFMVNPSEENWSGDTAVPYQLLAMSAFRAAENRVAVARSVNNGFSALIDPFGRVTERLRGPDGKDLFTEGVVIGDVTLSNERTFYTVHGDLFAFSLILSAAMVLFYAFMRSFMPEGLALRLRDAQSIRGGAKDEAKVSG